MFSRKKYVAVAALIAAIGAGRLDARAADPELATEDQKTLYALGIALAQQLGQFALTAEELPIVQMAIADSVQGKEPKVKFDEYRPKLNALSQARQKVAAEAEKKKAQAYLEKAAAEKGAEKTASGMIYSEIKAGTGDAPKPTDMVKVHYVGTLTDGTEFDSSVKRGQPASFPLNGVIKCWTEGVAKMKPGGKSKLVCPSDIAYGDMGRPPTIKPGATLVFEVELLEIVKPAPAAAPAAPGAPADAGKAAKPEEAKKPADAKKPAAK